MKHTAVTCDGDGSMQELSEVEHHLKAAMDHFFAKNSQMLDLVDERVEKLASGYSRVAKLITKSMDNAIMQKEAGIEALKRSMPQSVTHPLTFSSWQAYTAAD